MKGKWNNLRRLFIYLGVVAIQKGSFELPATTVGQLTKWFVILQIISHLLKMLAYA